MEKQQKETTNSGTTTSCEVPDYFSTDEVAKALSVSIWTVRSWIAKKEIESIKVGKARLIPESELDRLRIERAPLIKHNERES